MPCLTKKKWNPKIKKKVSIKKSNSKIKFKYINKELPKRVKEKNKYNDDYVSFRGRNMKRFRTSYYQIIKKTK